MKKSILSPVLIVLLSSPAEAYLCGDLNSNGSVSAADALAALRFSVGQQVAIDCGAQSLVLTTGQSSCFDDEGSSMSCEGSGHDGETQTGAPRAFTDNGNGTVTDRGTGLTWELFDDAGDETIHDKDLRFGWTAAFAKVALLNGTSFGGHQDWRLPNINELRTIGNPGRVDPGSHLPYFHHDCTAGCELPDCACIDSPQYEWSSTTYAPQASYAWALQMRFGDPIRQTKDLLNYSVRAVRGGYTQHDIDTNPVLANSCADTNGSDSITATDALAILRKSVGQNVALACIPRSPTLQTGQTACYNELGVVIPCAGTGQDGELQRGLARSFTNNENGTITDEVTALEWEVLSWDGGLHDRNDTFSWSGAQTKIEELNATDFAGSDDWRLPNFNEVGSLIDYGSSVIAVNPAFHSDCSPECSIPACSCLPQASDSIWASSTALGSKERAYRTSLLTGLVTWELKTNVAAVRGVRAGH